MLKRCVRRIFPAVWVVLVSATVVVAIPPGEIVLGDIVVFRLRTGSGKLDLNQRAGLVQDRINEVLAITDVTAKDVYIKNLPDGPTLFVRNIKLVTVDKDTAKAAGTTQISLAQQWAHRLMGVVAQVNVLPPVKPVDPTKPAEPITPAKSADPAIPTKPAEPAAPTKPADPAKPVDPNPPAKPADPVVPTKQG